MRNKPDPEKIAALKQALEEYSARETSDTVDHAAEEATTKIRSRGLRLLDQRDRSREELRRRLVDAEFDANLVDSVLDDFERSGLLNDARFAAEWVRQRHIRRGKSRRVLDLELQQKGVSEQIRADALASIDAEDEAEIAQGLAEKKARSIRRVPADYAARTAALRRIVGVLARRGFPHELSMSAATEALERRIEELRAGKEA